MDDISGDAATSLAAIADPGVRSRLFVPGERLGWVFRDRWQFVRPFAEEPPVPPSVPGDLLSAADRARNNHGRNKWITAYVIGGATSCVALLGVVLAMMGEFAVEARILAIVGAALIMVAGVVIYLSGRTRTQSENAVARIRQELREDYRRRAGDWQQRRIDHELSEANRVDRLAEWGAVQRPADTRRLDIFGGNVWAWQAFLTVYGTSALAERPVVVVDLSRELVAAELVGSARAAGITVDFQVLPDQLSSTTLLAGLRPRQIVDALIESMYGEDTNATRAERSSDDRILSRLCEALGAEVSLGRISAGLRALLDEPDDSTYLTPEERRHIADEIFSAEYRNRAKDRLHRLESYIYPLESLGTRPPASGPANLTCMALASEGRNVRGELLTDLIVQWLTQRIAADQANVPDVIIAGADAIAVRNLERLSDACERRGIRLTLLFRHLRETGLDVIGSGAVGFMKMGNNVEAGRAADYIGRGHRFVVSQITKTLGGNDGYTATSTVGDAETLGTNSSYSDNDTKSTNKGTSTSQDPQSWRRTSLGRNRGTGTSESVTRSHGGNWSTSRNWSAALAYAEGTNWSDAQADQRVYEYTVEPTQLQQLPDHVMLLVHHRPGGEQLLPVELDPAIVTLPRVSATPFPDSSATAGPRSVGGCLTPIEAARDDRASIELFGNPAVRVEEG